MGQGVGQGGRADGPQEAFARGGTQAVLAEALGGREDLFLVGTEQEDEQRLRAATRKLGSLNLRGDEPPDGEEIGPVMRVFRQFHGEVRILGILGSSSVLCSRKFTPNREMTFEDFLNRSTTISVSSARSKPFLEDCHCSCCSHSRFCTSTSVSFGLTIREAFLALSDSSRALLFAS